MGIDRVFAFDIRPGVICHLLQAQGNAFLFAIHFQNHNFQGLTDMEHFARMVHAAPAHIRDMEQAVHAAEVDKSAEVRDILHDTFHLVAFLDGFKEALALVGAFGFNHLTAGKDDILTVVIYLDDLEFVNLSYILVQVARRNNIHLGTGQESFHAHIDHKTALDDALHFTLNQAAIAVHAHDLIPVLLMGGLFLGKDDDAFVVFEAFQKDFNLVPHFDFFVFKLGNGNSAFGLVADVHQNDLGTDFLDGSGNNGTLTQFAELAVNKFRQFSCAHLNG